MNSIKLIGCFVAFIVLFAVVAPVSAYSYYGIGQGGSKFYSNQASGSTITKWHTTSVSNVTSLKYNFAVKNSGTTATLGQISAYSNYHSETPSQIFDSSESTSVSGTIYSFSKLISVSL